MINVLIVEDNYEDMEYCVGLLDKMDMDINIIRVDTGQKAMDMLLKNDVDIAFIDIHLPDCNGLKLAGDIRKIDKYQLLNIVFITVEAERQLEAYKEFHCYDYITKPFSAEQFYSAVDLLFAGLDRQKKEVLDITERKFSVLHSKDGEFPIEKDKILFAKSNSKTLDLFMTDRVIMDVRMKMSDLILQLKDPMFIRCHKSFAVNILNIKCIEKRENRTWNIRFSDSREICYISRTYYDDVIEKVKGLE